MYAMIVVLFAVLLVVLFAGYQLMRLRRQRDQARVAKAAWKDHAIALETFLECYIEMEDICDDSSSTRKERDAATTQFWNAEDMATATTQALYDMGEWPDAEESALFW